MIIKSHDTEGSRMRRMQWKLAGALVLTVLVCAPQAVMAEQGRRPRNRSSRSRRSPDTLKVGQVAPDFDLPVLGKYDPKKGQTSTSSKSQTSTSSKRKSRSQSTVKLSSFRGRKPVVLVFGSYT